MKKQSWFLMIPIILFSVICSFYPVWAEGDEPVVTQWMSPDNIAKPLHDPLRTVQPSIFHRVSQEAVLAPVPPGINSGRICIVVHQNIYNDITDALSQYEADLQSTGFNTVIYTYIPGTPEDLRSHLTGLYQEAESLVGAVLIGNIPYIIYEMMQDWGSGPEYEDFPCDIFYMDLDGTWSDGLSDGSVQPGNGKYDTRNGDLSLEIWVSRLRTDNLGSLGSERDILNDYFDKNHLYRKGMMSPAPNALVYNDDDWDHMATEDSSHLAMIYDSLDITTVDNAEETTAADYKNNHLTAPYEFIFIRSHGSPGGHGFYRNTKSVFEYAYPNDYRSIDPEAVFYSLFVCSGADYTATDNLAGTIAFNPDDSGLLSIGSTKTGGMWAANSFYTALENKSVFGDAFRQWFNNAQGIYPSLTPRWWYGMVLIGDAALTRSNADNSSNVNIMPIISLLLLSDNTSAVPSPTLVAPTNGSTLNTLIPLYEYDSSTSSNATELRLEVSKDPEFTTTVESLSSGTGSSSFRFGNNLEPSTTYYWRTWFMFDDTEGPYSEVWSFTTGSGGTILPAPALTEPADGSVQSIPITIQWSSASSAVQYLLKWRITGTGGYNSSWVDGTERVLSWLDSDSVYEWWVSARNDYAVGTDSETWQFTTPSSAAPEIQGLQKLPDGFIKSIVYDRGKYYNVVHPK